MVREASMASLTDIAPLYQSFFFVLYNFYTPFLSTKTVSFDYFPGQFAKSVDVNLFYFEIKINSRLGLNFKIRQIN